MDIDRHFCNFSQRMFFIDGHKTSRMNIKNTHVRHPKHLIANDVQVFLMTLSHDNMSRRRLIEQQLDQSLMA